MTLNLFQSVPPSVNEHDLKNERISTRLSILLLALSLIILLLYNSLIIVIKTDNLAKPTFEQYKKLYSKYFTTLTCPCNNSIISYETILNINYTLHQACTSTFVIQQWINYHIYSNTSNVVNADDFRSSGKFAFQALNSSCELVNRTIVDNLSQFLSNQYVSTTVTPENLFQSQIQTSVRQFNSSIINNFVRLLDLIKNTTQINGLHSALMTNYDLEIPSNSIRGYYTSRNYTKCRCHTSPTCMEPFSIYNSAKEVLFRIPGLYRGCYIIEALLQSSLECFYDQICINNLRLYLNISSTMNMTALDSSSKTRYSVKSTIKELLDQLMIEEWNPSWSYENYYNECQPIECTYIHETKNGIVYIITALFGLVGGLITVLKIVVPLLVKFLRRKKELETSENSKRNLSIGDHHRGMRVKM
ncbi:unnamed protein product [Adineta ricciae]|uniref:Uncharacterized protein n=1 Tax=Adineta ricciae TaxID=249248 RepID=A0A816F241_ADIRI|nr:unnamed protein product [Adineta ricciae]